MSHRTRAEQKALKVRKDPKKLARPVRIHRVENLTAHELEATVAEIEEGINDYYLEEEYDDEVQSAD